MAPEDDQQNDARRIAQRVRLFRHCLPERVKLGEIARNLPDTGDLDCLTIGTGEAMIAYHLHQRGGRWQHFAPDAATADAVSACLGDSVRVPKGRKFPFKDKTFDVLIVLDALERAEEEEDFIVECHRVLKPAGRLLLCVPHAKAWSVVGLLQTLFGQTFEKRGMLRPGYTEPHLFRTLKDGFDMHAMHSYSRFCTEAVRVLTRTIYNPDVTNPQPLSDNHIRAYSMLYPLYWLAYQLDFLLFFTRGHHILSVGKRRAWLPRKTPILSDGRSISEAVLSRIKD